MFKPIVVPSKMMPRVNAIEPCPCQLKPVRLTYKKAIIYWEVELGERVQEGQIICEGEIEKKVIDFFAPCTGILIRKLIRDGEEAGEKEILGYIECEQVG